MLCSRCHKGDDTLRGEVAAYWIWGLTPLFAWVLGPLSVLTFAGLGLYLFKAHHSRRHVCPDCRPQGCPQCGGSLASNGYCGNCRSLVCAQCGHSQAHEKGISWLKALWVLPISVVLVVGLFFVDPWLPPVAYLLYVLASAPACKGCGEKVYLFSFG